MKQKQPTHLSGLPLFTNRLGAFFAPTAHNCQVSGEPTRIEGGQIYAVFFDDMLEEQVLEAETSEYALTRC